MTDAALLSDPTRCPACGTGIGPGLPACASCGLPLRGPLAAELWQVSLSAAALLARRTALIARMRGEGPSPAPATGGTPTVLPAPGALGGPVHPGPDHGGPGEPGRDVGPGSVRAVLLGLGVLLLAVAAFIFTVLAWSRFGITGRAMILAACTGAAVAGAALAERRRLPATGEALACLTVALLLLDAYAARRLGLAAPVAGEAYWAGVLAAIAATAAAASRVSRLHAPPVVAAVAAQLPLPVLLDLVPGRLDWVSSLALTAQAALLVVIGTRPRGRGGDVPVVPVAAGAVLAWWGGIALAGPGAFSPTGEAPGGEVLALLATAVPPALVARAFAARRGARVAAVAVASLLVLAAASAALTWAGFGSGSRWDPLLAAGLALAAVLACAALPWRWREGALAAPGLAALIALPGCAPVLAVPVGQLGWASSPWVRSAASGARNAVYPPGFPGPGPGLLGPAVMAVLVLGVVAALAGRAAGRARHGLAPAAVAAALGAAVVPALTPLPLVAAVSWLLLVGVLLLLAAAALARSGAAGGAPARAAAGAGTPAPPAARAPLPADAWWGWWAAGLGSALLALGVSWSFASEVATVLALPVAAGAVALLAAAADPPLRLGLAVAAVPLLAGTGAALVVSGDGGIGWGAACAAGIAAACPVGGTLRLPHTDGRWVEGGGWGSFAVWLLVAAATGLGWPLVTALTVGGIAAAVTAMRPDRRYAGVASGVLLAAASWVRLADAGVGTVEAYAVPPALALLAVGWWRRRTDRRVRSWTAYGPGLVAGLVPSLLASWAEPGLARPLLLGGAALVVLLVGVARRLRAPLAVGGAVLALDALAQVAPYADLLPRWVGIGAVGLLLLVLGATYERRLRDVRQLRARYQALA